MPKDQSLAGKRQKQAPVSDPPINMDGPVSLGVRQVRIPIRRQLELFPEVFSISADRRGGVFPPSFAGDRADCGAGFQPARAGKDARTTNFKVVEVQTLSRQGAVTAPLPKPMSDNSLDHGASGRV